MHERSVRLPERSVGLPERSVGFPERSVGLPAGALVFPSFVKETALPDSGVHGFSSEFPPDVSLTSLPRSPAAEA